jgi:Ribbon-helix-helix protein, copG family
MPTYGILRKNEIKVYFSDKELKIVEEMAAKEDVSISEYIRVAVIADACLSYNLNAWKLTYNNASRKAKAWLHRKMGLKGNVMEKVE